MQEFLTISDAGPIEADSGGLFVSTGLPIKTTFAHHTYELMFVKQGTLEVVDESRTYLVEKDQSFVVWPMSNHGIVISEGANVSFYWIMFGVNEKRLGAANENLRIPKQATITQPERLLELLHRFLDDQRTDRLSAMMGAHLIGLMLCEIYRSVDESAFVENKMANLVDKVQIYIARNFHRRISTSTVAAELNYNADYLERVFRGFAGISITEAIHKKRIREARRQLMLEYKNVSEIAYACGFTDSGYFRRVFKRHTDMTPTRFRSLYSQVHMHIA